MSLKSIRIDIIPHDEQRYPTVGDWIDNGDELEVRVSDMGNNHYELAVAIHEIVEAVKCLEEGVDEESVNDFDIQFEEARASGDNSEPGNDPAAPYYNQHQAATRVERTVISEFGEDWDRYNDTVCEL